ncbi:cytidylate kinase family protein [Frankia sp. Cr1]|uniref:cytidylate kinase family protein n=1 Tax=Frankia sp. Cr1 TaxID=3073931 RepID=UPI002AD42497|nr:cytidylate kinase family protein [Frankia sp. Cr1]
MAPYHPNVAFAGLTAAGKTTHARILAAELGCGYVSATEVLLEILGIDVPADGVWFDRFDQIRNGRQGDSTDDELDRRLEELAADRQGTIFDTWALAWLAPEPMVRVWIESDLDSRARKCYVSQTRTAMPVSACRDHVQAKDADTRASFLRRHEFDLFTDRHRYDLMLCNSHLIQTADRSCADAGIAAFAPVVGEAVTALLNERPSGDLAALADRHPTEILRIGAAAPGTSSRY